MADKPIIRNLTSLKADMVDELRQILHATHIYNQGVVPMPAHTEKLLLTVERKTRNVLEFLTGSRE